MTPNIIALALIASVSYPVHHAELRKTVAITFPGSAYKLHATFAVAGPASALHWDGWGRDGRSRNVRFEELSGTYKGRPLQMRASGYADLYNITLMGLSPTKTGVCLNVNGWGARGGYSARIFFDQAGMGRRIVYAYKLPHKTDEKGMRSRARSNS